MRGDRGSATLLALAIGSAVMLIAFGVARGSSFLVSRAQARTAADMGALAGSAWARAGEQMACARAELFAADNGAVVVSCSLDGLDLWLTVEVGGVREVARAGPVRSGAAAASIGEAEHDARR